jgi:hypothetical protein
VTRWFGQLPVPNIGARTDHHPRIDIDLLDVAEALRGDAALPHQTRVTNSPSGGLHIAFITEQPLPSRVLHLSDGRRLGEFKAALAYVGVAPNRIGAKHYVDLSPPDLALLRVQPIEWLDSLLPQFGFHLDLKRAAAGKDYEALAGTIFEGEGRHLALSSYAGKVWLEGWSPRTLIRVLTVVNEEHCRPPLPADELEAIADHFVRSRTPNPIRLEGGATAALPNVCVTNRYLRDLSAEGWNALLDKNNPPSLFQHGDAVADVHIDPESGRLVIRHLDRPLLKGKLDRAANWLKASRDDLVPARPPTDVVDDMLSGQKPLPMLRGIVATPVFSASGEIVTAIGYQEETQLFFAPPGQAPPAVSRIPGQAEVQQARSLIEYEWLGEFPFVDQASRANAVAAAITPFVREMISGCVPLHIFDAPAPGTGKGLVTETLAAVVSGSSPGVMNDARTEEEIRKRVTSLLREGPALALIDNVRREINSATLAALLTSRVWVDRQLGNNDILRLPNRALWMATGNNIRLSNEIARRSVWIRLDSRVDRPWEREGFRHPRLSVWVEEHRHELVWAVLTLVQNWIAVGRPAWRGKPLGSFESWSQVLGGILEAAGIEGFMANRDELYKRADTETEEWRAFIEAWWDLHGEEPVRTADLVQLLQKGLLPSLTRTVRDGASERSYTTRLGTALVEHRDRRYGQRFLRGLGTNKHAKVAMYCLEPAEPAGPPDSEQEGSAKVPHETRGQGDSFAGPAEPAVPGATAETSGDSYLRSESPAAYSAPSDHVPRVTQVTQPDSNFPPNPAVPGTDLPEKVPQEGPAGSAWEEEV